MTLSYFQNGDYNKPIPAQFKEDLNHGVSAVPPSPVSPRTLQWVNSQMLLCKKCNKNQSAKIKQLASFIPREDVCTLFPHTQKTFSLIPWMSSKNTEYILVCFFFVGKLWWGNRYVQVSPGADVQIMQAMWGSSRELHQISKQTAPQSSAWTLQRPYSGFRKGKGNFKSCTAHIKQVKYVNEWANRKRNT